MLKIFKNKFFVFLNCKNKHKKGKARKAKKGKVNTWKHRRYIMWSVNFFNWLSTYTFLLMNIIMLGDFDLTIMQN